MVLYLFRKCLILPRHLPGMMICVQQFVSPVGHGTAQIILVAFLYRRISWENRRLFTRSRPYNTWHRSPASSSPSLMGCPPPPAQPPGHAIISTKSYLTLPFRWLPSACGCFSGRWHRHLQILSRQMEPASFQPSIPRTSLKESGSGFWPVTR